MDKRRSIEYEIESLSMKLKQGESFRNISKQLEIQQIANNKEINFRKFE